MESVYRPILVDLSQRRISPSNDFGDEVTMFRVVADLNHDANLFARARHVVGYMRCCCVYTRRPCSLSLREDGSGDALRCFV